MALGYDDYSKARFLQALAWLQKADSDALLHEFTLFWRAQTEHALNKNADSARDFATLLKDYPSTAIKEQLLEVYVPVAIEVGHSQDALDALATYPPTNNKPPLLLVRARAYEAAHKYLPAVKDYQTLYYKFPLSDESRDSAASALSRLNKQLHSEFPYAGADAQDQRAQIFFDSHKWKEART